MQYSGYAATLPSSDPGLPLTCSVIWSKFLNLFQLQFPCYQIVLIRVIATSSGSCENVSECVEQDQYVLCESNEASSLFEK